MAGMLPSSFAGRQQPQIGDFAICQHGYLGLITSVQVKGPGLTAKGVHLWPGSKSGTEWSSSRPIVLQKLTPTNIASLRKRGKV